VTYATGLAAVNAAVFCFKPKRVIFSKVKINKHDYKKETHEYKTINKHE